MASSIFEDIVASALRVGGRAPSQQAVLSEAEKRKGLDLQVTLALRADEDLTDSDIKSFEAAASKYVDDLIDGLFRRNLDAIVDSSQRKGKKTKIKVSTVYGLRDRSGKAMSALNLTRLLNLVLYKYAQQLMGSGGRLVNRTGRLAHSGVVTQITQPTTGSVSIFFKYMTYPYEIFEPEGRMGSSSRSPSNLFKEATTNALEDILSPSTRLTQIIRWVR